MKSSRFVTLVVAGRAVGGSGIGESVCQIVFIGSAHKCSLSSCARISREFIPDNLEGGRLSKPGNFRALCRAVQEGVGG